MEASEFVGAVLRWIHVVAGLLFVGTIWWQAVLLTALRRDGESASQPGLLSTLLPRSFTWLLWSGRITWLFGFLLLGQVFYHGGMMFEGDAGWTAGAMVMAALTFFMFPIYNGLVLSPIGRKPLLFGFVALVLIAVDILAMIHIGQFTYRAYVIHLGAMFGTIMVANLESMRKERAGILSSVASGSIPEPGVVEPLARRLTHNLFLAVPLLWTMIEAHTAVPAADSWWYLLGAVLVGWGVVGVAVRRLRGPARTPA